MRSNSRADRFFRSALIAVCFALLSVMFGAYMRQSEANLGCPDGPACESRPLAPFAALDMVSPQPHSARAWKETVARYLGIGLSIWLLRLAALGWQFRHKPEQQVIIPLVTLVLVFTVTIVGVVTIDLHSKPLVMMIQYLGGMVVLALLWWIALREQRLFRSAPDSPLMRQLRPRALAALVFGFIAIVLGA
jgi:heme a synthase